MLEMHKTNKPQHNTTLTPTPTQLTSILEYSQEMELEQILLAVQKIGALFKAKRNDGNPALLRTLLSLRIGEGVSDIDIKVQSGGAGPLLCMC
jgi:hypothetical protein